MLKHLVVQCRIFDIQNCTIRKIIAFSAFSAKWELSFTMRYHDRSISIKTGVSRGNKKSIFDVRINVSGGRLQAKLKNVPGFSSHAPLSAKKGV